jgi:hypothetical protein
MNAQVPTEQTPAPTQEETTVPTKAEQEIYVAIWSKAVDTQMHFNEMSVKSRQLGLAFVAAALGVSVVLISRHEDFSFQMWAVKVHVSVLLLFASVVALWAVKRLDLDVYHRMLRGAVTFGEDFEEQHIKKLLGVQRGMTQAVSHFSRYSDASVDKSTAGAFKYSGSVKVTAEEKIRGFYKLAMWALIAMAMAVFAVQNVEYWASLGSNPTPESNVSQQPSNESRELQPEKSEASLPKADVRSDSGAERASPQTDNPVAAPPKTSGNEPKQ